jgi:hypothetical protein
VPPVACGGSRFRDSAAKPSAAIIRASRKMLSNLVRLSADIESGISRGTGSAVLALTKRGERHDPHSSHPGHRRSRGLGRCQAEVWMNAYLVRITDRHEIVGIFVCRLGDLFGLVDEIAEPLDCEFAAIGCGGIMWEPGAQAIPPLSIGDDDTLSFAGATATDSWLSATLVEEHTWNHIPRPTDIGG